MNFEHGGNLWQLARKQGIDLQKIIDFSANINPLGIPQQTKNKIIENIDLIVHYPDPDSTKLINELSRNLELKKENILVGNGSTELIYIISGALLPKKIIIPIPTFNEYEKSVIAYSSQQTKIKFYSCKEKQEFKINIDILVKFLQWADTIFICNPNNPTGSILSKSELIFLAKKCTQNDVLLILDETFIDFVKDEDGFSMIHNLCGPIIILRSFTKIFAIPGLRLGYLVADKKLVERIKKFKPTWSVNLLAQIAGCELLKDKEYIQQTKVFIEKERDFIYNNLTRIKTLKPFNSAANFILIKLISNNLDSEKLQHELIKKNILIRDCSNFRGLNHKFFRISIRKREENIKLLNALKEII